MQGFEARTHELGHHDVEIALRPSIQHFTKARLALEHVDDFSFVQDLWELDPFRFL